MSNKPTMETELIEVSPEDRLEYSIWYNPTEEEVNLKVYVGFSGLNLAGKDKHGKPVPQNPWKSYPIPPGGRRQLPAEYDAAVHVLGSDGKTIIGGGAPQLVKVGEEDRILHPALDVVFQKKKSELEKAADMLQQKEFFDDALLEIAKESKKK